ncbi:MAG: hypothetical protein ACUZ77_01415 [Candidatus Brocadiales bacterium]
MGIEQLIWAVLILLFLIVSALKNLQKQKKRTGTKPIPTRETPKRRPKSDEELKDFLEDLMGVERPKKKPPIRHETEEPAPTVVLEDPSEGPQGTLVHLEGLKTQPLVVLKEPKIEEEPYSGGTKGTLVHLEGLKVRPLSEAPTPVERPSVVPKIDLKKMIIFSEIIGPPIAKRRSHRLF